MSSNSLSNSNNAREGTQLKIVGITANSFIDYPGKIAYMVFTYGCDMDCWYCHNREQMWSSEFIPEDEVLGDIFRRKDFVEAVVITGGEATLQGEALLRFIPKIKEYGLCVKLDTNGNNPAVLKKLLPLLDYVAMDIKDAKFSARVKRSVDLLMQSSVAYEFRTTFSPDLTKEDIEEAAKQIKGAPLYALQQYRRLTYNPEYPQTAWRPHSTQYVFAAAQLARKHVKTVVRGAQT